MPSELGLIAFICMIIWAVIMTYHEERIKNKRPKLEIKYKENEPNYYDKALGYQIHRISIHNLSSVETIKNLKAKLTEIQPLHGVFKNNRPILLHFMGDNQEVFNKSIDLDPTDKVFIDVIELHSVTSGNSYFKIPTSEILKTTEFIFNRDESFKINIQASGLNIKTEVKSFKFGITTNDVGGDWKLWFKPID
jgi:hypothetical protein